jgi:hypothetical protein
MEKTNRLPEIDGKQYAPFITVDYEGEAWISEGNHRIKAAAALGWKYLPVEVRYFTGGEEQSGALEPSKVKKYDSQAVSEGFEFDDKFRGKLDKKEEK